GAGGAAQPVGPGRVNGRPGGAEEARDGQGASEAPGAPDVSSAPPGRNPYWRLFPRVALALLAPPVATNLRPSGAASILATPSTGGATPKAERNPWKVRELLSRPGGAEEARGVQGASEAQDAPDVSSAPPGRNPYWR